MYSIDEPSLPSVILTRSGNSIGIGIFQQQTGVPIATFKDDDGDGVFDFIQYSALSVEGYSSATVEDFNMDGSPDFVLYLRDGKPAAKVAIGDEWIDVNGVGTGSPPSPTVEIDGETKSLEEVLKTLGRP